MLNGLARLNYHIQNGTDKSALLALRTVHCDQNFPQYNHATDYRHQLMALYELSLIHEKIETACGLAAICHNCTDTYAAEIVFLSLTLADEGIALSMLDATNRKLQITSVLVDKIIHQNTTTAKQALLHPDIKKHLTAAHLLSIVQHPELKNTAIKCNQYLIESIIQRFPIDVGFVADVIAEAAYFNAGEEITTLLAHHSLTQKQLDNAYMQCSYTNALNAQESLHNAGYAPYQFMTPEELRERVTVYYTPIFIAPLMNLLINKKAVSHLSALRWLPLGRNLAIVSLINKALTRLGQPITLINHPEQKGTL